MYKTILCTMAIFFLPAKSIINAQPPAKQPQQSASAGNLVLGKKLRTVKEGFVAVKGGNIWYHVAGSGNKTPVLLLHGGPGGASYYLNPLLAIGSERPVITFDQLGCGRSDRISDTSLMTVDSYVEQIKRLLNHLGIKQFYLYGHSWGSILATEYYLKYKKGIKGLILASPIISSTLWAADADSLIATLPDSVSEIITNDKKGVIQNQIALDHALNYYLTVYGARKRPISADFTTSLSQSAQNVLEYLWGNSEFIMGGALKNYDRTKSLHHINIATLYIIGEFDEVRTSTVKYYQALTPQSSIAIIKNAGHMTMHDNPEENIKVITDFINSQEKRSAKYN